MRTTVHKYVSHPSAPGCVWKGGIPAEKYKYSLDDGASYTLLEEESEFLPLLLWIREAYYDKVASRDVIFKEELRYIVQKDALVNQPIWECMLQVFDIWEQQELQVRFRLNWTNASCFEWKNVLGFIHVCYNLCM